MNEQTKKKKYRVNLPQTSFPMKASLAVREPECLKLWESEGLEKRVLEKAKQGKKKFILHDGPPYANGHIHIGHALNKTLKDIIVRFKTHQGCQTTYVPGWDCHGLPIEHTLLKEMGKKKDHVDQLEFRKKAREYAGKYVDIQKKEFQRLGVFGDWDHPYLTMSFPYQAAIARSFYELYDKGYIFRGEKPVYWCMSCETALAEAELEYQDKTSQAIFAAFPTANDTTVHDFFSGLGVKKDVPCFFLIWTTTPWTLPANVGIALNRDLDYGIYDAGRDGILIFAAVLEEKLKEKLKLETVKKLHQLKGSELRHRLGHYQHPFIERTGRVILADYVSGEDGTGIVHIAPGHGEEDYVCGHVQNQLDIISPVNYRGQFTEDFGKDLKLKGINVFDANQTIVDHLRSAGQLRGLEKHGHSYPFCWRCQTPVIVRSTPQWFLNVDHEKLRDRVIQIIQDKKETRWFPDWGKNRISKMMETRPDWCLSRQRLWGVPIPVVYHKETGEVFLNDRLKEKVINTFETEGADAWFSKSVKDWLAGEVKDPEAYQLETDILDVWFDSGVSHQAVLEHGYELGFPSELYLEGSDQHRGWFQTSLITAVALRGRSPFSHVLTHGFVVDGQGKKMSKSQGNVVSPQDVMKKYGADILRLWVSSCDTNNDIRMSPEILERMSEAYRKIRNTFRYLLGNIADFDPARHVAAFTKLDSVDQWVLSRFHEAATEVVQCYEQFKFHRIYQLIYEFCINDLSAFYLDVLKDRLYCHHPEDPRRRSSQTALFMITKGLCQLAAPILVFTADEVWRSFKFGNEKSIHETDWEQKLWQEFSAQPYRTWNAVREIRRHTDLMIEKLRETKTIGSSLDCRLIFQSESEILLKFMKSHEAELKQGLMVSAIEFGAPEASGAAQAVELAWQPVEGSQRTDKLTVQVLKAKGEKCARCWKYEPEVGSLKDPLLCERCFEVENKLGVRSGT